MISVTKWQLVLLLQELLESGYLTEVHKFSKFIHGSCTLCPEMVQAVPYWVDDESVRPSMLVSAPPVRPAIAAGSSSKANGQHTSIEVFDEVNRNLRLDLKQQQQQ